MSKETVEKKTVEKRTSEEKNNRPKTNRRCPHQVTCSAKNLFKDAVGNPTNSADLIDFSYVKRGKY